MGIPMQMTIRVKFMTLCIFNAIDREWQIKYSTELNRNKT